VAWGIRADDRGRGPLGSGIRFLVVEQGTLNPLVAGSSPARVTFISEPSSGVIMQFPMPRPTTLVSWIAAPDWLTIHEASDLSGHDPDTLRWMIQDGAVDTRVVDGQHLIDAKSLEEYQKCLLWVLSW
jgi:hypothetical protein